MRYIKWKTDADLSSFRRRHRELFEKQSERTRREKVRSTWGTVVFFLVTALLWGLGGGLIYSLIREETKTVWEALLNAGLGLVLGIGVLIAAPCLGALAAGFLWGTGARNEKQLRRELLSEACAELRAFYGFREPFLVTKCYDSSERRFKRHDVCLFFVDGELRMTANVHYGFFDPEKDLGCYIWEKEELTLTREQYEGRTAVRLTAGEVTFLLGSRAGAFIEGEQRQRTLVRGEKSE